MKFNSTNDATNAETRLLCAKLYASPILTEVECKEMLKNTPFGESIAFTVQNVDLFKKPSIYSASEAVALERALEHSFCNNKNYKNHCYWKSVFIFRILKTDYVNLFQKC